MAETSFHSPASYSEMSMVQVLLWGSILNLGISWKFQRTLEPKLLVVITNTRAGLSVEFSSQEGQLDTMSTLQSAFPIHNKRWDLAGPWLENGTKEERLKHGTSDFCFWQYSSCISLTHKMNNIGISMQWEKEIIIGELSVPTTTFGVKIQAMWNEGCARLH